MIRCPNCGADMRFDPHSQKLSCENCDSQLTVESQINNKATAAEEYASQEEDSLNMTIFTCPQCGGELLSDDNTAATFCSFCGASILLESRVSQVKKPDLIIPFKMDRDDCSRAYQSMIKKAVFAPSSMKSQSQIDKFRAIYMPYWVYSYSQDGPVCVKGEQSRRMGDYVYTSHFRLDSYVNSQCDGIHFDSSSAFADRLSDSIAPYDLKNQKPFSSVYMSGYYADLGDVPSSVYEKEARDLAGEFNADQLLRDPEYMGYGIGRSEVKKALNLEKNPDKQAFFPVWFLSSRNKSGDRVSYAVVNGQTGKISADIPIDPIKYLLASLALAIPLFIILNMLLTMTPSTLMIANIVLALAMLLASSFYMDKAYAVEIQVDNKVMAPIGRKIPTLIKPAISAILQLIIFFIDPVSDIIYYVGAIIGMLLILLAFVDLLKQYNLQTTRPFPQFNKRGGDE